MTPGDHRLGGVPGSAPRRDFDANRFVNWRFFWDYSGGNVFENMCQQLAFWYKALDLQIPRAVSMLGGVHLWKDGREVPDTMSVAMEHAEEILFSWDSGFGNNQLGTSEEVLGTDGTLSRGQQIGISRRRSICRKRTETLGQTKTQPNAHVRDFLECIRTGEEPNAPAELGYRVSIACRMAVESYRQGRTVRWDPAREEISEVKLRRDRLKARIGVIGGSGLYSMPGFEAQEEVSVETPWGALGQIRGREAGGEGGRLPGAPRARPPHLPVGAELPRQYLRHEVPGRGAHHLLSAPWAR